MFVKDLGTHSTLAHGLMAALPLKIAQIENSQIQFDDVTPLLELLHLPENENKKICFLSIIGSSQNGKTFTLNHLQRYLEWTKMGKPAELDWMEMNEIGSFADSKTVGIDVLLRLFPNAKDEEFLVLLADTQGLVVNENQDNVCIVVLTALLSSVMIFNQKFPIRCDDLRTFSELGDFVANHLAPYQFESLEKLIFLLRDCYFTNDRNGFSIGSEYLANLREGNQQPQVAEIWELLEDSFNTIEAFCLPHRPENSEENVDELKEKFNQELRSFC
ncbi:Interferon-induced guanylate-binding protein 2-like protein [Aphelenchoides besseyi]|nr:Interferon-induced guanylate-binding protein 2-like protein [Aphelenchoides besseyi]